MYFTDTIFCKNLKIPAAKTRPHEVGFYIVLVEARGFEPLSENNAT